VIGIRAVWPGLAIGFRRGLAIAAGGCELLAWWLFAAAIGVRSVDAYTLPLAGLGLVAGWLAARRQQTLRSWICYGPALLAGFVPSLAPILFGDASPGRRLVVGVAALAVVILGARERLQAPVLIGGGALLAVAVHETVLIWRHLPSWLPLSVAGLLLIGVATTYERRRRDFARLRGAVGRMA
jgi:hypothetical protein